MSQPTEHDLLEALDRRARAAVDELASAVATVPVPEPDLAEPGPRRPFSPLLVAAAVVLIALVGAVLVRGGGSQEDGTVAGQPSLTHLVLPDPEAAGYELVAAFDGTEEPPAGVDVFDLSISVQGPVDSDDPWATGVLSYSLPAEMTTLGGEAVELGDVDATYDDDGIAATVGWVDGDEVRYLVSSRRTRDELVDLARAAVVEATPAGEPLPGQRIVFTGTTSDVFPTLASAIGAPQGLRGVAYAQLDADDGLVVATRSGDEARLRAASVVAESTEQVTVRGRDAIVARFGADRSLIEVTWLEADGTLVRAGAGLTPDTLVAVLDQLEPIDDEGFAELVRSHPVGSGVEESFSDSGSELVEDGPPSGTGFAAPIASVELQIGDRNHRAALTSPADGSSVTLEANVDTPGGSSGAAIDVTGLDVEAAVRNDLPDGTVAVAAVIGPHEGPIEVRDAASGQVVDHRGGSLATIEGSDHSLVLVVVTGTRAGQQLVVVGTAPDGREIRIPV
jgi:hypothetical protein